MARTLVLTVESTGESRRLDAGMSLSVGRGGENRWALPDAEPKPTLSRRHCRFIVDEDGASVTDLESTNGTKVDGQALTPDLPVPLLGGEVLELGPYRMSVEWVDADEHIPGTTVPPRGPDPWPPSTSAAHSGKPDTPPNRFPTERHASCERADAALPGGIRNRDSFPDHTDGGRGRPDTSTGPQWTAMQCGAGPSASVAGQESDGVAASNADRPPFGGGETAMGSGAAALAAFLDGAGLPASAAEGQNPEALLHDAGQVFACLAGGLRELLAVRATVKDHARLDRTRIGAMFNNPLKLSANRSEATAALLGPGKEGYMTPLAAAQASFRDLKVHEIALLEALQSAADELVRLFDPAALEGKLADAGMLILLLRGGRRARLWELYRERYGEMAESARRRFMGCIDGAFREAYARKSGEFTASAAPRARGQP